MDREENKELKSLTEAELHRLHGEASREISEILRVADDKENNPEAHVNFEKAAKELDETAVDIKERYIKRVKEVEDISALLIAQNLKRRGEAAANSDVSHLERDLQEEGVSAVSGARPASSYGRMVSRESADFQKQNAEIKSYLPQDNDGRLITERFDNFRLGDIYHAVQTKATSVDVNDNLDVSRGIVMANDPAVPIGARLNRIQTVDGGDTYTFYRETGAGGAGTAKASKIAAAKEGTAYAQQDFAAGTVKVVVEKLAAHAKATVEQLADVSAARGFFETRFRRLFEQALEKQIVAGDGSPPNWRGLVNQANIQTQQKAKGTDPYFDIFITAWQKLAGTAYVMPNLLAMPSAVRALWAKKKDTDGRYIWSSVTGSLPTQLFGIPIANSEHLAANTALMLDTNEFAIVEKQGLDIQWGLSEDDFVKGIATIVGTLRGNVLAWRPNAAVSLTDLNTADS